AQRSPYRQDGSPDQGLRHPRDFAGHPQSEHPGWDSVGEVAVEPELRTRLHLRQHAEVRRDRDTSHESPACLMRKILALLAAVTIAAYAVSPRRSSTTYEKAQRQTVLVSAPGGTGTGVVIARKNLAGQPRYFFWTASHVAEFNVTVEVDLFV